MELLKLKRRIGSYQGKVLVLIKDSFGACGMETRHPSRQSYKNSFVESSEHPERLGRYTWSPFARFKEYNLPSIT